MKILFVCTANRDRSHTAEAYYTLKYPEHEFRSAGINKYLCERHEHGVHLRRTHLDWADRIVCAELIHSDYIVRKIDKKYLSKIEVLHLEDTNVFMSKQLIDRLEEKIKI